jgi:hypothetical protein
MSSLGWREACSALGKQAIKPVNKATTISKPKDLAIRCSFLQAMEHPLLTK